MRHSFSSQTVSGPWRKDVTWWRVRSCITVILLVMYRMNHCVRFQINNCQTHKRAYSFWLTWTCVSDFMTMQLLRCFIKEQSVSVMQQEKSWTYQQACHIHANQESVGWASSVGTRGIEMSDDAFPAATQSSARLQLDSLRVDRLR